MSQSVDVSRISELMEVVGLALTLARAAGASQAEADASLQRGLSATVRLGEVDTIEYHRDRGLSVTAYFGQAKGSASTADLRPQAVRETVQKADTSDLVFDPVALVRYISTIMTLQPGDLIATGTPGGVGHARKPPRYLVAGMTLTTEIEGIGRLENAVHAS